MQAELRTEILSSGHSRAELRLEVERETGEVHAEEVRVLKEKHAQALIGLEDCLSQMSSALSKQRGEESMYRVAAAASTVTQGRRCLIVD